MILYISKSSDNYYTLSDKILPNIFVRETVYLVSVIDTFKIGVDPSVIPIQALKTILK